jgi:uncharacterized protein with PIN domain
LRFLLDGMLGKLSRWLRMLGYETLYQNDLSDNDLLAAAKRDSLILLTSDEELYRTASIRGLESFLIQGRTEPERLASLAKRYNLTLKINPKDSRCPTCGSPIKETPKDEVEGAVPPATFKVYSTFWVCTNPKCAKLYWQGSHWKKIEQTLEAAKKILDSNSNPSTGAKHAKP